MAILLVRVLYPGAGLLALSAWCLGILNSHRRFLLPYAARVVWNLAIVVALIVWGTGLAYRIAEAAAWGSVAGSALQLAIQIPPALRLLGGFRPAAGEAAGHLREVLRIEESNHNANYFYADVLLGIQKKLWETDYFVIISHYGASPESERSLRAVHLLKKQWVDGIILVPSSRSPNQLTVIERIGRTVFTPGSAGGWLGFQLCGFG